MAIARDGHNKGHFNALSGAVAITNANANDEIIVAVAIVGNVAVSSVTSDKGVSFSLRKAIANGTTVRAEEWYGGWTGSGTITITVTMASSVKFVVAIQGISGLPSGTVFDANASLPKTHTGTGSLCDTGNASTSTANDYTVCIVAAQADVNNTGMSSDNNFGNAVGSGNLDTDTTGATTGDVLGGLQFFVASATFASQDSAIDSTPDSLPFAAIADAVKGFTSSTTAAGAKETLIVIM